MIKAGVPAALVTTTAFRTLADNERKAKGVPDLPLLMIEHPLGGEKIEGVRARAEQATEPWSTPSRAGGPAPGPPRVRPATRCPPDDPRADPREGDDGPEIRLTSERIELDDSPEAVDGYFAAQQWSDGLPVVPPTEDRVRAMLAAVGRDPQESLGAMPPAGARRPWRSSPSTR